jgi:hypothetical protein
MEINLSIGLDERFDIDREFSVTAMARSGHHAVVNWIINHFHGWCYFANQCEFYNRAAGSWHSSLENSGTMLPSAEKESGLAPENPLLYRDGKALYGADRTSQDTGQDITVTVAKYLARETAFLDLHSDIRSLDAYFHNYEDLWMDDYAKIPSDAAVRGKSRQRREILILRDPYNWLASVLKVSTQYIPERLARWKRQAEVFLHPGSFKSAPNLVTVNFNRWFAEADYRCWLSANLGLSFTDRGFHSVPPFGGGSSFDGQNYDGNAGKMRVCDRWREFAEHPEYRDVFARDADLDALSREIFAFSPLT